MSFKWAILAAASMAAFTKGFYDLDKVTSNSKGEWYSKYTTHKHKTRQRKNKKRKR